MTRGTRLSHWIAQELQPRLTLFEGNICEKKERPTADAKVARSLPR